MRTAIVRPLRGTMRPHLGIAKAPWTSPTRRPPGGRAVLGADPVVGERAACVGEDPELFFEGEPAAVGMAKRVCAVCPVRTACLDRALVNGERYGVFGGLTADERRSLLRKEVLAA
ncbi:WhiB family transcriptional regulator [Streptomyces triculaminicus]|uniref:WhiB family transcriptional regulator n=1 Tax=Streptomyces triculaminicus TaxID=2816232 RepID=UPI00379D1580